MGHARSVLTILGAAALGAGALWLTQAGPRGASLDAGPALGPAAQSAPDVETHTVDIITTNEPAEEVAAFRRPARTHREEVSSETWDEIARRYLASTHAYGDVGQNAVLESIRRVLDPDPRDPTRDSSDPWAINMPTAEEMAKDHTINPIAMVLPEEDMKQLQAMLDEYSHRMRERRRDHYIATQIGLSQSIIRGDFVRKPNGSDPEGIWHNVGAENKSLFSDQRDANLTELPGSDFSHNRIITLTRESSPDYFRAVDAQRALRAEFEVTVRMFFLPQSRR